MRIALFIVFFTSITFLSFSQSDVQLCGTDEYSYELYRTHPHLQQLMKQKREELKQHTAEYTQHIQTGSRSADSVLIIPVVFHVIHNYGNENISDAQLLNGLQVMNRNFSNQHPDTGNITPAYKPLAANCEIEFRLAQKDPNGNCTNGINRIASPLTVGGYHNVKDLIHWDPSKYLNIYIVRQIPNLAGHCLMPDQAAAKPEWDGIVISHQYVGNIGTSNELRSVVLAHEAGHYLNLFHIWGGNNVPDYFYLQVGQQSNCGVGDEVDDTPPTIGWSSCQPSNASCGNTVDNYQNAMDYSYCNFMFTEGQKQRMRAALRSPVANRNNLVSQANLYATGVLNPDTFCIAQAAASKIYTCIGDSISFFDKSLFEADSWEWNFGDGEFSFEQNPKHVYEYSGGTYNVILKASKNGVQLQSEPLQITVADDVTKDHFFQDFETINNFNQSGFFITKENENVPLEVVSSTGFGSAKSGGFLFADTFHFSGKTTLLSPTIDLTNTPGAQLNFNYYFSQKKLNINDVLEVFYSTDCGKTWASRLRRTGNTLRTIATAVEDEQSVSTDTAEWNAISLVIPENYRTEKFQFKIEFTNYYGNNLLFDNININPELYVPEATSIKETTDKQFSVFPNPATNTLHYRNAPEDATLKIIDMLGKEISGTTAGKNGTLDIAKLPSGIYCLTIFGNSKVATKTFSKL